MEIKTARIEDAEEISRIHALSWKTAYRGIVPDRYLDELEEQFWASAFKDWICGDILTARVLYEDGQASGCIAYGNARDKSFSGWGEIVSLYLLPEHFGKGVGIALMNNALDDLSGRGFDRVYLWVLEENLRAQNFYKKVGFEPTADTCTCEIGGRSLVDVRWVYHMSK